VACEELVESHPTEQAIEDRQSTDAVRDEHFVVNRIGLLSSGKVLGTPRLGLRLSFSLGHVLVLLDESSNQQRGTFRALLNK
jgi:hypothetical protein